MLTEVIHNMATSSITKEFTVKNIEMYEQIVDTSEQPKEKISVNLHSKLEQGERLLASFSFRYL